MTNLHDLDFGAIRDTKGQDAQAAWTEVVLTLANAVGNDRRGALLRSAFALWAKDDNSKLTFGEWLCELGNQFAELRANCLSIPQSFSLDKEHMEVLFQSKSGELLEFSPNMQIVSRVLLGETKKNSEHRRHCAQVIRDLGGIKACMGKLFSTIKAKLANVA